MTLNDFLTQVKANTPISFADTMTVISENYTYHPATFRNGTLENTAGQNEGSCKIFTFARLHNLTEAQTLQLFDDYYRVDVLAHPDGTDHQNIRQFMQHGWSGISFENEALQILNA